MLYSPEETYQNRDQMAKKWFNSTVIGASLTSLLSDLGHESVTVLMPAFLASLGAPAYALGLIEGLSDAFSSFAKLLSGYFSDKIGKRKEISTIGYLVTGIFPALVALATIWPIVLIAKIFAWVGRGARGPPRNTILANSVDKKDLGKAFGFHRAGDTVGAILGPLWVYLLIPYFNFRQIFWLAVIPGVIAAVVFWLLVKEKTSVRANKKSFLASLKDLPENFKKYLLSVGLFGIADFSHTLLIFFVVTSLTPSMGFAQATGLGVILYMVRNISYALGCYPFGFLGDKIGRKKALSLGYAIAVITFLGFIFAPVNFYIYLILFILAGLFIAAEDTLEDSIAAELVGDNKGLAFGTLATVNGMGDFISSITIGFIWSIYGFTAGFVLSLILAILGTLSLLSLKNQ